MRSIRSSMLVILASAAFVLAGQSGALAHEPRAFNGIDAEVGWVAEPPTTGVLNGVLLIAHDAKGKPVTGLDAGVEVSYQGQTLQKMPFVGSDETPGTYSAAFIPTRPGEYDFHVTGTTAGGASIDQTFKPGHGLEDVTEATSLEFPAKDPALSDLALRADRVDARIASVKGAADSGKTLGLIGVILGGVALLVAVAAMLRRRKSPTA